MALKPRTSTTVKKKLRDAFRSHLGLDRRTAGQLLASATLQEKAYELNALIEVMARLKAMRSSLSFILVHGSSLVFRAKGGPIDRAKWPYIRIDDDRGTVGELWVDIECLAISAGRAAKALTGQIYGKCHELDIVLVVPGTSQRPLPDEVLLGVEAKHRVFNKALLKELLGVRREMTMRTNPSRTRNTRRWFIWWAHDLPAQPPSGLVAFCSSNTINLYRDPADFWGIHMEYLPL